MARKGKRIKPDQLAPRIAEGFTEGPLTPQEARREFPASKAPTVSYLHMTKQHPRGEPYAALVVERNGVPIQEPNTGRWMEDVDVIVTEEEAGQIISGYRCLKCKEHFELAFPLTCGVCGYEVKERQILEAAMEMEGTRHVGPSKPLTEYLTELEARSGGND